MKKIISFAHISLDGFAATPNRELTWVTLNQEIFDHVGKRIAETDTALYGRITYDLMESYWPTAGDNPDATKHDLEHSAWYRKSRKVVLSRTLQGVNLKEGSEVICENLPEKIHQLKQQGDGEILLFGSPAATHSLLEANLIDGFWLFLNPVLLGDGIPLFKGISEKIKLNLVSSKPFSCGVVELNYTC